MHPPGVQHISLSAREKSRAGRVHRRNAAMPFLSPLGGEDAADFYFGYDAGYHRSGGAGKSAKKEEKKEKGFLSCLPCFIPCCTQSFLLLGFSHCVLGVLNFPPILGLRPIPRGLDV